MKTIETSAVILARADHAEDFLADVWRIGAAWSSQVGGTGSLHIRGRAGRYTATWCMSDGPTGLGDCIADAILDLARRLSKDLRDWSAEEDADLSATLDASAAMARLGGA